jgi:cytochrome c oxidase assembly protein subunit 15
MLIAGLLAVQVTNLLPSTQAMRGNPIFRSRGFAAWLSVAAVATYGLLLTGSFVTRSGASLACPSFPLCGSNAGAIRRLIDIQMLHRYVAFSVAFLTIVLFVWIVTRQKGRRLTNLTYGIGALLLVQFGLGVGNVLLRLPMWTRVLHLTVATTFWAGMVVLWAVCFSRQPGPKAVVASSDQSKD